MSRDLGRDVPDLEKLYARELWADFSYPKDFGLNFRAGQKESFNSKESSEAFPRTF